jgi:hypothetical protein
MQNGASTTTPPTWTMSKRDDQVKTTYMARVYKLDINLRYAFGLCIVITLRQLRWALYTPTNRFAEKSICVFVPVCHSMRALWIWACQSQEHMKSELAHTPVATKATIASVSWGFPPSGDWKRAWYFVFKNSLSDCWKNWPRMSRMAGWWYGNWYCSWFWFWIGQHLYVGERVYTLALTGNMYVTSSSSSLLTVWLTANFRL